MAYKNSPNPFNPLIVGAVAVIVALAAFLIFREADTTQQAGIQAPPAATSPATTPAAAPRGEVNPPPATPNLPGPGKL